MTEATIPGQAVAEILAQAKGRDQALTSGEISRRLRQGYPHRGWGARQVRRIISDLQDRWSFIVCATPGGGFYIPEDFDEVRAYYLFLSHLERRAIEKREKFKNHVQRFGYQFSPEIEQEIRATVRRMKKP